MIYTLIHNKGNLHLLAHRRHVTINVTLSSEEVLLRPRSLLLSIEGPGAEWLELQASWFRLGELWFWGEFLIDLLPLQFAVVIEMDADCCCWCWFFIGDLGRRASISGVVTTRWGASGGGFRPPPPCHTLPSLSAKFLTYAWKYSNFPARNPVNTDNNGRKVHVHSD